MAFHDFHSLVQFLLHSTLHPLHFVLFSFGFVLAVVVVCFVCSTFLPLPESLCFRYCSHSQSDVYLSHCNYCMPSLCTNVRMIVVSPWITSIIIFKTKVCRCTGTCSFSHASCDAVFVKHDFVFSSISLQTPVEVSCWWPMSWEGWRV